MLQILFLIIKIIGILLAALLGLAFLLLLLVLFVPVRYRAYGIRSSRECRAEGRVSWLLRLFCIPFSFQDGELEIKVKILGFTVLDPLKGEEEAFREPVQKKTEQSAGKKEEFEASPQGRNRSGGSASFGWSCGTDSGTGRNRRTERACETGRNGRGGKI